MAGNSDIGLRAKVEGEREFKSAMSEIGAAVKALNSEMRLVASQFDKNDASQSALASKGEVLTKQVDVQRQKVELLSKALEDSKVKYGENSTQTNKLQIDLNNAQASLNKMERELNANTSALSTFSKEQESSAAKQKRLGSEIEETSKAYVKAKGEFGKYSDEAKTLKQRLEDLVKEQQGLGKSSSDVEKETRTIKESFSGLGGLLKDNVTKSLVDIGAGMIEAKTRVVEGAKSMGESIIQFAKDTISGENTIKALGDTLRDKLQDRLSGAGKETKAFGEELKRSLDAAGSSKDKLEILNREIDTTAKEYSKAADAFGKNSTEAKALKDKLEALAKEQRDAGKAAEDEEKAVGKTKDALNLYGKETEEAGKKTSVFGDVLKASIAADAVKAGLGAIVDGIKAVAGAVGGFIKDNILAGGFDRALNLEQASFKLQGLGHDAKDVARILDNEVTKAVKGTAFSLDAMAGVAAGAMAAGIPTGKELERTLSLVADASAVSGKSIDEMGTIFNKVAAAGKVSGKEINQLSQAGIPIMQLLSKTTGQSIDKIQGLVSEGKIGMAEFQAAIEKGMGGAAKTMGQTWKGSIDNMHASMSRLGAQIVGSFTDDLKPAVHGITDLFDFIKDGTGLTGAELQEKITGIATNVKTAIEGIIKNVGPILDRAIPIVVNLLEEIVKIVPELLGKLTPVVTNLFGQLLELLVNLLPELLPVAVEAIMTIAKALIDNLPLLIDAAMQIILQLASGISTALPELIPAVIEAIITIAHALLENIPLLIDVALQLMLGLAAGLVAAIPDLIMYIPGIIVAIVKGFAEYDWGGLGASLLEGIGSGFVDIWPKIKARIKEIWENLVLSVKEFFGIRSPSTLFAGIGKNLIQGLWAGIGDMTKWIKDKILGFASGITDSIKDFFGIKSPSTVFAAMGKNMAEGMGEGFGGEMSAVEKSMLDSAGRASDSTANETINAINKGIVGSARQLSKASDAIISQMSSGLTAQLPHFVWIGSELINTIGTGMNSAASQTVSRASGICDDIIRVLRSAVDGAFDIGANLVYGFWDGIESARGWFFENIRYFIEDIKYQFVSGFQIQSPSKWFRDEIGKNLALGLGDGFDAAMDGVARDMRKSVPTDFKSAIDLDASLQNTARGGIGVGGLIINLFEGGTFINNTPQDSRSLLREISFGLEGELRRKGAAMA